MRGSRGLWLAALCGACSPGPGRQVVFPDAATRKDAAAPDAYTPDAGFADAGVPDSAIALPDGGPRPQFKMSGIFGIVNDSNLLYARESDGRLSVLVGALPYSYIGTISANGAVDLASDTLNRAGCPTAHITGTYDRAAAFYVFQHNTCSSTGQPVSAEIRGGFANDFDPALSGVYELQADVSRDDQGCFGRRGPFTLHYGVQYLSGVQAAMVFTAVDVIDTPQLYTGMFNAMNGTLSVLEPSFHVSMSGSFQQANAHQQPVFTGTRDLFDPATNCTFAIHFQGPRIAVP